MLLILTARCNGSCRYCYQNAHKSLNMSWGTLAAAVDFALNSAAGQMKLTFLGGEPLLEWEMLCRAVKYASQQAPANVRLRYAISTNGLLLTDEVADFLDDRGFSLQLSFDGVEEAQDFRNPGSFQALDRLIERLKQRNPELFYRRLRVCMTLTPATIPYLVDSVRYFMHKGICRIGISPSLTVDPDWADNLIPVLEARFSDLLELSLKELHESGRIPVMLFRHDGASRPQTQLPMCGLSGRKSIAVDVDGQVYGCAFLAESYQEFASDFLKERLQPMRMGRLADPDFAGRYAAFPDALRRAELFDRKELKSSAYGKCSGCRYFSTCSVCPVSICQDPSNRDPHRVPDFICAFNRAALAARERFPALPQPLLEIIDRLEGPDPSGNDA